MFARKSSQLRAKKEANGVEAFAYSTQETCSTGLTWPTASPFLSLSLLAPLFPPLRSIHVNPHWACETRLQEHNVTLDAATSPRILSYLQRVSLFLSLARSFSSPCPTNYITYDRNDRHGKKPRFTRFLYIFPPAPTIKFQFENLILQRRPYKAISDPALCIYI